MTEHTPGTGPTGDRPANDRPAGGGQAGDKPVLRRPRGADRTTAPAVPTARPSSTPALGLTGGSSASNGSNGPSRSHGSNGSGSAGGSGMTGPLRALLGPVTGSLRLLGRGGENAEQVLRVDWPQCRAHGLCHEIAPEVVHLDEWGYPLFDRRPLSGDDLAVVRRAVQVCPTLALRLTDPPAR